MVLETESPDPKGTRSGLICLVTGVVLLLWAWGSWVYRTSEPGVRPTGQNQNGTLAAADQAQVGSPLPLLLVIGLFAILLVLFVRYVLLRRRGRSGRTAQAGPSPPSASGET